MSSLLPLYEIWVSYGEEVIHDESESMSLRNIRIFKVYMGATTQNNDIINVMHSSLCSL